MGGVLLALIFAWGAELLSAQEMKDRKGEEANENALIEMTIKGIALQPGTHDPVIVLVDKARTKALPIWIGFFEARAIAMEMEHVPAPRPMTHDLIKNMLEGLKAKVKKITITELNNGTFFAAITFLIRSAEVSVDSRPSDAIALAVRVNAPVYVVRKVLDHANTIQLTQEKLKDEEKNWRKWLEDLPPNPSEEGQKLEL